MFVGYCETTLSDKDMPCHYNQAKYLQAVSTWYNQCMHFGSTLGYLLRGIVAEYLVGLSSDEHKSIYVQQDGAPLHRTKPVLKQSEGVLE